MIFFYLLISVMPLITHPLWSDFVGELTMIKYLGGAAGAYALLYLVGRPSSPRFFGTWQARWFVLFTSMAIVSYLLYGIPVPFEISPLMSYTSFLLLFFVTLVLVDSVERLRWVFLVAIASVAFGSLHVLREWEKYGGFSGDYRPGWVVGDPNYYTLSALLILPAAFLLLRTRQPAWERWFCIGSLVVTLCGVTVAASRGGFLGLGAAVLYVVWHSPRRWVTLVGVGAVLAAVLVALPSAPLSRLLSPTRSDREAAEERVALWAIGVRMVTAHPLTGIGTGNFKPSTKLYDASGTGLERVAHNVYIEIAAEMGVPGLLVFGAMLGTALASLRRVRRSMAGASVPLLREGTTAIEAGLVAAAVAMFFLSAQQQKLLWLMLFLSMCLPRLAVNVRVRTEGSRAHQEPSGPVRGHRASRPLQVGGGIVQGTGYRVSPS